MNYELVYDQPLGRRLHKVGFWWVTTTKGDLWWNGILGVWEPLGIHKEHSHSTHAPCKSLKAFKRMLKKHPHLVECEPVLVNRYSDLKTGVGYNITCKMKDTTNAAN